MTRITHRTIQESTLGNLQRNLAAMGTLQEQLSSQKRINRPSDDPTGTVSVLQLRAEMRATEQHGRNADDGIGWLSATESAMKTTSELLRRAQGLTLQALNTGAQSPAGLEAIALEIEGLRGSVVAQANTEHLGRSVFAGTAGGAATSGAGPAYAFEATTPVMRQVASESRVRVDTPGATVFGEGESSVFALLDRIAAQVRGNDPTLPPLSALKGQLDGRYDVVTSALSSVGARYGRVADAQQAVEDRSLALMTSLSDVESIDLPATIVQLQSQDVAYKAALGATAKVLQPSLMDFLR